MRHVRGSRIAPGEPFVRRWQRSQTNDIGDHSRLETGDDQRLPFMDGIMNIYGFEERERDSSVRTSASGTPLLKARVSGHGTLLSKD